MTLEAVRAFELATCLIKDENLNVWGVLYQGHQDIWEYLIDLPGGRVARIPVSSYLLREETMSFVEVTVLISDRVKGLSARGRLP